MRRFLSAIAVTLLTASSIFAQPWPEQSLGGGEKLLFNEDMIIQIRDRIEKHEWARNLYERIQDELSRPPLPQLGEGKSYPEGINRKNAALYYRISGDERFLPDVVPVIIASFKLDRPSEPLFTNPDRDIAWDWCMNKSNILVAYDLLRNHPSLVQYKELMDHRMDEVIAKGCKYLRARKGVNNTGFWITTFVAMAGYMRGDKEAIAEAIDGQSGMKAKMMEFRDGGRFNPEPINYTTNFIDGCMLIMAECSRNNGMEDLYSYVAPNGASIKFLVDSYFDLANASGQTIGHGDFGDYVLMNEEKEIFGGYEVFYGNRPPFRGCHKLEIFNARYNDPKLAWAIAQNPARDNRCFVFWGYTALTHGADISNAAPPEIESKVFPEMGNAIIRSVENKEYWNSDAITAHLRSGITLRTHNQKDAFNLTVNAFGKNVYKDWFVRWDYLAPRASNGRRNSTPLSPRTIGHNTVTVDFDNHKVFNNVRFSELTRHEGFQTISVSGEVYKGVQQCRRIGVTDEYVVDIFTLSSDKEHNFDYALHSIGKAEYSGTGSWKEYMQFNEEYRMGPIDSTAKRPNNVWFLNARLAKAKKDVVVNMQNTDGVGVIATVLSAPGTEVISAGTPYFVSVRGWDDISPKATIPERKPFTVIRRKGTDAEFCVLHQPYRDEVSMLRMSRRGDVLTIEGKDFSDTFNIRTLEYARKQK